MTLHLKLLSQLRKCFKEDTVSMFYHGEFDDSITDKMISLISMESEKKIRGNLAFTIAESFQNVVRHKDPHLGNGNENVFGIRGHEQFMHVFSSNLLADDIRNVLSGRIDDINAKNDEELKASFLEILESGELSERGGAGMGLLEMKRRSGNPLQCEFIEADPGVFSFNLQVDFNRRKNVPPTKENLNIEENSIINDLMIDHDLLFIYKGQFNEEIMDYFIPIVENSSAKDQGIIGKLRKAVTGLVENIQRYGIENNQGIKTGLFALKRIPNGFYVSSGNYTVEDIHNLESIVDDLNVASPDELDAIYERVKSGGQIDSDRIGLLDIRRTCADQIELKYNQDERGTYTMIGAVITDGTSH